VKQCPRVSFAHIGVVQQDAQNILRPEEMRSLLGVGGFKIITSSSRSCDSACTLLEAQPFRCRAP
jgi:hypothetical protein